MSLALGLIVCLALVAIQLKLTAHNARTTHISARDNEARVAMDIITREVSGGGFLLGGLNCPAVLNYNASAPSPGYFATLPVSSISARSGLALPFVNGGAIVLNYPSTASGVVSDVLVVSATAGAGKMNAGVVSAVPNAAFSPTTDGRLPVLRAGTLAAGDTALVQVTLDSATGQWLCLRVPVSALGTASGSPFMQSSGSYMPAGFYAGFSTRVPLAGMTGTIGNAQLQQARVIDIDPAALSNQRTFAYYVDNADTWPVLMRATFNAANDTQIGTPQAIAAGVVSLQVLFGVDTAGGGLGQPVPQRRAGHRHEQRAQRAQPAHRHRDAFAAARPRLRQPGHDAGDSGRLRRLPDPDGLREAPLQRADHRDRPAQRAVAMRAARGQRGDALVFTLLTLLVVGLGFLVAMRTVLVDTQLSGNHLARQKAVQVSDIALRSLAGTLQAAAGGMPLELAAAAQPWWRDVAAGTAAPDPAYWAGCLGNADATRRCAAVSVAAAGTALPYTALAAVQTTGRPADPHGCGLGQIGSGSEQAAVYYDVFIHVVEAAGTAASSTETVYKLCISANQ